MSAKEPRKMGWRLITCFEGNIRDGQIGSLQQYTGAFHPYLRQILMRRNTNGRLETADEMKRGKPRLRCKIVDRQILVIATLKLLNGALLLPGRKA